MDLSDAEHFEMRAATQRRNAETCGPSTARGQWYLQAACKLERQAWAIRQRLSHSQAAPEAVETLRAEQKRQPGPDVRKVIKLIRRGKSNDDICAATGKGIDAVKRIRSELKHEKFDLSWLES